MTFLISVFICVFPLAAIAYPLLKKIANRIPKPEDESSLESELERRWQVALDGMKNSEIEFMVGNLSEADYQSLRESYVLEASIVLKLAKFSQEQQKEILDIFRRKTTQTDLPITESEEGP